MEKLEVSNTEKEILKLLEIPRSIAEVAAELNVVYDTAQKRLKVMYAKKYLKKINRKREVCYYRDQDLFPK